MTNPTLYIIAGANGSGKTTFALQFIKKYPLHFINADELAKSINPSNLEAASLPAGRLFFKEIDIELNQKNTFVIESTLSGKYLKKIIKKAKNKNYEIHIIYIFLDAVSPEPNIQRVAQRVQLGGHNVRKEDIIRRYLRGKFLFWNTYKNLSDKWTLYSNPNDFERIAFSNGSETTVLDSPLLEKFEKGVSNDI